MGSEMCIRDSMYIAYRIARYTVAAPSEQRYCKALIDNKDLLKKYEDQEYMYICRLNDALFKSAIEPIYDIEQLLHQRGLS